MGARRSEAWLRQHFKDPRSLVSGSTMPSYTHLFEDERGEALIAYLSAKGVPIMGVVLRHAAEWQPKPVVEIRNGRELFLRHCMACHGEGGRGDGPLSTLWIRRPANLVDGPFTWTAAGEDRDLRMARVIKFGIIGTDMPGHETLTNDEIGALVDELRRLRGE